MMGDDAAIRCAIKEYRKRKGFSQDELARLIGVRRQAVYDMETGRYLPNTAVALRLARVLGCTVEMLFGEKEAAGIDGVHLLNAPGAPSARLVLAEVGERVVGVPLRGDGSTAFRLEASDGLLLPDNTIDCLIPRAQLVNTVLMLGCDPALNIVGGVMARTVPGMRAHAVFASSGQALTALREGKAHAAAIHYHNEDAAEGNLEAVRALFPNTRCLLVGFSLLEEGIMVAPGNPLHIKTAADMASGRARFVNREQGAALRKLLDARLARHGVPASAITGYATEVRSHFEGAMRVASGAADAALGLRVAADSFGLDFVPLAVTRCDLVIPEAFQTHAGVAALLDILQSAALKKEINALSGYDAALTGKAIAP